MPGEGQFADLLPGKSAEEYYAVMMKGNDDESGDESPGGESKSCDPGGCGQVVDAEQGDPAAAQAVTAEWQVAVSQAQTAAAGRGPLPAGLGRAVD